MAASTSSVLESDPTYDPYVELCGIRGTELVKWSQIKDINSVVVKCTICMKQINHLDYHQVKRHYRLKVIVCKECFEFYGTDEFSKDENGNYNYCTWCGNGGKLFLCDFCPHVFCMNCIRRNFGRSEVTAMQRDGWKCCMCDTSKIQAKAAYCDLIIKYSNDSHKKTEDRSQTSKEHDKSKLMSETWLQDAFCRTDSSCKNLQKKLNKLKNVEVSRSKSLKHIIKKMEEVVSRHKSELGSILKALSEQYNNYVKEKQAEEESKIKSENGVIEIDISEEASDVVELKDEKIETETKENGIDANQAEQAANTSKEEISDSMKQQSDIELAAKLDLLKDSSEEIEDMDLSNNSQESKNRSFTVTAEVHSSELPNGNRLTQVPKAKKSFTSVNKPLNVSIKNCAIKESSISSLSSASDSESFQKSRVAQKKSLSKKSKEKAVEIDYEKDDKLRGVPTVILENCDSLLNGHTTIKVPAVFLVDELDKAINNITKSPEIPRKCKERKTLAKKSTSKKAVSRKKVEYSSSSITFSSESEVEEEKQEKSVAPGGAAKEDLEEQAKKEILGSSDDSSLRISSDSEEEKKKPKKKSAKLNSDSSDDFVPKKKKKFDKLLNKRLLSDDETSKGTRAKKSSEKKNKRKVLTSEDEDEQKTKTAKSDSTTTSDSDDSDKPKRKRRKRIKKPATSSSENDDKKEDKEKETPKKGRKDIKKIISKKDLQTSTKEAQQAEKERKKRIEEKQKLYNVITEKVKGGDELITKKLVLEVDPTSKEELVEIHPDLIEKLKPHQVNGVKFMWECTIESLKELEKGPGSGCILAHCMGLGKTLQVITFLHTCLTNRFVQKHIKTAMVICPYNTVLNWSKEVEMWLSKVDSEEILLHEMSIAKDNYMRLDILKYWHKEGGLLIISYDIFRRLANKKIPKLKKGQIEQLHKYLLDPGPDIAVCDEGHILKNEKSAISKACCLVRTQRRIVLTGTPLQNNLKEYHCMLSFVKPNLLGTSSEFLNRFVNPIMNGQYEDSNEFDVRRMKKRIHILHKLVEGCVQRCDYCALTKFLLPKHEYVLSVKLSETQINMYRWYLENLSKARGESKIQGSTLFQDYNLLRNICAHPRIAQISSDRAEERRLEKELEKEDEDAYESDFINDNSSVSGKSGTSSGGEEVVKEYRTRSRRRSKSGSIESLNKDEPPKEMWYDKFINEENAHKIELSGKMVLLMNIFKECEAIGDKIIVFSQSLLTLDCVEDMLEQDDKDNEDVTWIRNLDYFRMDGSTSADYRKAYIESFNDPNNTRARLFLVSTKAGGLGTNLVGANRVVIMDASWNPSHDVQAIFRVYRFGQKKPVYIYRLLAQGTMEEKVYDRQVSKQSLSIRVVDEQQIDRHFNSSELAELYTFDPESMKNRPTPNFPKDRLLAEMLVKYKDMIMSYHEHDSLLQNETETDLTEEERKAAWAEFENEKEGQGNISVDEEITKYCTDPDFNEADYSTPAVAAARFIIDDLLSKTRKQCEGRDIPFMRKTLLHSIRRVKNYIQEKHVMVLRMKQDYLAKGSVPATVQKYLEELSSCLTHLNQHYIKVNEMVQADEKIQAENFKKAYNQQQANLRAASLAANIKAGVPPSFVFPQGLDTAARIRLLSTGFRLPNMMRMPNQPYQTFNPQPTQSYNQQTYSKRTQRTVFPNPQSTPAQVSQPVITDPSEDGVEEVVEVNDTPTSTTSSVVIEEIVD